MFFKKIILSCMCFMFLFSISQMAMGGLKNELRNTGRRMEGKFVNKEVVALSFLSCIYCAVTAWKCMNEDGHSFSASEELKNNGSQVFTLNSLKWDGGTWWTIGSFVSFSISFGTGGILVYKNRKKNQKISD